MLATIALLAHRSEDLRDNFARLADNDGIPNEHALALDLGLVVQGSHFHRRSGNEDWLHHCVRGYSPGTAYPHLNVLELRGHFLRRILIGNGPARRAGGRTKCAL